jgi:hypothetical protein
MPNPTPDPNPNPNPNPKPNPAPDPGPNSHPNPKPAPKQVAASSSLQPSLERTTALPLVATALRRHVADPDAVHAACWALRGLCCAAGRGEGAGGGEGGIELRKGGEVRDSRLSELRQAGGVALLHAVVEAHGGTDGRIRSLCTALLGALEAHGAAGATLPPERRGGLTSSRESANAESANVESAARRGAAARRVAAAAAAARDARDIGEAQAAARQVALTLTQTPTLTLNLTLT